MSLQVTLERPLPASLPLGAGTAVFCTGICFDDSEPLAALDILVDGRPHPVSAFGMLRPDVARVRGEGRGSLCARSGFWATVPLSGRAQPGTVELTVAARLRGGSIVKAPLGTIEVVAGPAKPRVDAIPQSPGPGLIAVCMATFQPNMDLFRAQIQSLRDQHEQNWICVISDDCSAPEHFARVQAELPGDKRFFISRSEERLGFYRNFERALTMVPPEAEYIALSDQDDRWHPDKLGTLREALVAGDAILAYSDLRLVEADGRVLRETMWRGRANNYTDIESILIANTITGAATMFRRELIDVLLPFPDTPGFQFHDTWLAVAALAAGEIAYVDRPLYDYVQHRGAVFGHVTHGAGEGGGGGSRIAEALGSLRSLPVRWRAAYLYGYLAREAQAQAVLVRCDERLTPAKRRALERYLAAERSMPALLALALRPLRMLTGRTETLASEIELAQGVLWKRFAAWGARGGLPLQAMLDASGPAPDAFSQKRLRRWRARIEG